MEAGVKGTRCYKLTDENGQTYNETQWGPGVTHVTDGEGELCGPGWLHCYDDPILAVMLNPQHAAFKNPRMWLSEGSGNTLDDRGMKRGYTTLTTVREYPLPEISTSQHVAFGILCALEEYTDVQWREWAEKWLSGEDRSSNAASNAASYAASYAARADSYAASYAARAASYAARAASNAASYAASNAANAANAASLDLVAIASWAMALGADDSELGL